jgi:hypothetical protein
MSIKFECGCRFHQIEFDSFDVGGQKCISICIYEHKSGKTGKLLKKPKLLADVMLHPEVAKSLIESIKNGII